MKIKKGSCLCGAVKYRVKLDKLPLVYNCHCIDCRKKTGGAFVTVIQLRDQALDINKDNLTSFKHPGYSKKNLHKFQTDFLQNAHTGFMWWCICII